MDNQTTLTKGNTFKPIIRLQKNTLTLEKEKERFISDTCNFLDPLNLESIQEMGRPRADSKDILKSLLVMSYYGMSYRRAESDLKNMHEEGLLRTLPPRSTLNDYVNDSKSINLIEKLIQVSSLFFIENDNTIILDSTWFGLRMYSGGYRKVHDKKSTSLQKVRKLHLSVMKNSKIIVCALPTVGTMHDSNMFRELIETPLKNGFQIKTLLADAGYSGKNNYVFCREKGIMDTYIDFKSNATLKRAKSDIWREKLRLFKEQKEIWNEAYRFRVIVEGVISSIKRKNLNYLRSRNEISRDVEILLKCLVYNLTVIGKYS